MTHYEVVAQLREAVDRAAARSAAYDLARVAVDDAVAVTPGAASRVVTAVRGLVEAGTPWRADAFAVLNYVVDHAHVYRGLRAGARTYRGEWDWGIAEEEAVEQALSGFDRVVRDMLDDPDPETRSLASLVLARVSGAPAADRELLKMLADAEPDGRARASAVEARLRLGEPEAGGWLTDDAPETRHRIAWYLAATRRDSDPALVPLVRSARPEPEPSWRPEPAWRGPESSWRWPAEEI
ncbi:hypothetical protein DMB66_43925 [Actinoplanes sp. ATCC 53533]|uniref:hypothetical protein n=1 Tax=Actinoplanes sp. ATCC 53533 TaxID=1288362 RepID=UPI000F766270|nr:hypothetical protein [Actinoplanes sp. ATCC 53533]RSM49993.1 hypothetical protein DMB66_43925 [Actinoplanes sp. ATCC 53533]